MAANWVLPPSSGQVRPYSNVAPTGSGRYDKSECQYIPAVVVPPFFAIEYFIGKNAHLRHRGNQTSEGVIRFHMSSLVTELSDV